MFSWTPSSSDSIDESNPYAAPQHPHPSPGQFDSDDEVMRRTYLTHEATIKSIGICYLFLGALIFSGAVGLAFVPRRPGEFVPGLLVWVVAPITSLAFMLTGFGMYQLRRWSRTPVGVISGIGLMGVPLWTLINGYILYIVFCERGRAVFSDEYQSVIRRTPHIRYRKWIIVWILLTISAALLGVAFGVRFLL